MKTSERLLSAVREIWDGYYAHPFVAGIREGTLDKAKFRYYIIQDYLLPSLNVGAAITTPPSHHRQLYPGCPRCCACHCTSF